MANEFATSSHWQQDLVLLAKNTYVWLHQLSQKYAREISTLDQIPLEELQEIRSYGITALWLIGLWERSPASRHIKQLYGHHHLIGSAYSVNSYNIASSLGGDTAMKVLKQRAAQAGILLACDIIPNHTGLDAPWVLDHPQWYISTFSKPVSTWQYNSENLSPREDIQIRIEDGYYTQQEAAEAFQYTTSSGFGPLYIYHGNDGTSMPWNDTAQLDYLNPIVREKVRRQIIAVAQQFPIIRLDAAMTLIRHHFKRLWYPDAGENKCIPTREKFQMSQQEFDQRMPNEFWAEVLQDLQKNAPDTLLLAEAFWLMEKYFVHEIGMHRVYNSAFLNNLRDENNAQLRDYFKEILSSDANLLERFVNYLTTPDEAPAVNAFGKGDKYFGVCGFMAALPGLPLFGHGQMEGLSEHYGMDFEAPMLNEFPDYDFLQKHRMLIAPLLHQRSRFTDARRMRMFDFQKQNGGINENVFAFSICSHGLRTLIIYNNCPSQANGYILQSSHSSPPDSNMQPSNLVSALELEGANEVRLNEIRGIYARTVAVADLQQNGLDLTLSPYQLLVLNID